MKPKNETIAPTAAGDCAAVVKRFGARPPKTRAMVASGPAASA
jgi:hypothetical protein